MAGHKCLRAGVWRLAVEGAARADHRQAPPDLPHGRRPEHEGWRWEATIERARLVVEVEA